MITGTVTGQTLRLSRPSIVADTIDYLTAEFTFSSDWDGHAKVAHFSKGSVVYDLLLEDDAITEDKHLNLSAGVWSVYLHGDRADGQRITTSIATLSVSESGVLNGQPLPDIPQTIAEQIVTIADTVSRGEATREANETARKTAETARETAEAGRVAAEEKRVAAEERRESVTADAETLSPGSSATAAFDKVSNNLHFGIPRGEQGFSGVYVGGGDIPSGYNVQIDPTGDTLLEASDVSYLGGSVADALQGKQEKLIAGTGITIAADGKTISAGGGASSWSEMSGKPFASLDSQTLIVTNGVLAVHTTDDAETGGQLPITAAGVNVILGNIGALLASI